jgi:GTP-binding protein HflX
VARAHAGGEVTRAEHGPDGTLLEARVTPELAAELEKFGVYAAAGGAPAE